MDTERTHFKQLLEQFLQGQMKGEELASFIDLLQEPENNRLFSESIDGDFNEARFTGLSDPDQLKALYDKIKGTIDLEKEKSPQAPVIPMVLWRRWTFRAAASVLLLLCGALAFYYFSRDGQPKIAATLSPVVKQEIAPGRQTAELILADGSSIVLDNLNNGVIATQNGVDVLLNSNQVSYEGKLKEGAASRQNTLKTPKGGQYQLTLSDGTKVWLNAASSITFPVAFNGPERKVAISGEVYFEVKKNARQPFVVQTKSESITVLGTHFNVNCYDDEPQAQTTLLEGAVKIGAAVLKPGQSYRGGQVRTADVNQAISWTKGTFNFNHMPLDAVMRQISRWYDVEIIYPDGIPKEEFWGEVQNTLPLTEMLAGLHAMDIHFKINGKKLIIRK